MGLAGMHAQARQCSLVSLNIGDEGAMAIGEALQVAATMTAAGIHACKQVN